MVMDEGTSMFNSDEMEQLAWDSLLIKGWSAESRMGSLLDMYRTDYPNVDLRKVRRFPCKWELTISARVFVARYIPKLSEKLWDNPKDALFWLMMNGDKITRLETHNGSDKRKLHQDINEIRSSQILAGKINHYSKEQNDIWAVNRRSEQWAVCK
jgi:hypothetical protein